MSVGKESKLVRSYKIGYINGESSRLNEKVVDGQWISYLGEYVELVKIPPVVLLKLFGGSIPQWHNQLPDLIGVFADGLAKLCEKYGIKVLYLNMPFMVPYVLLARNKMNLDLKVVFFGHSVASEFWLKIWIATAPFIKPADILLCPSSSCKKAMINISDRYQHAYCVPHSIKLDKRPTANRNKSNLNILSIGRIEDVKNIDFLIRCFAAVKSRFRQVELTIAGEYTGKNQTQIQSYQNLIQELIQEYRLNSSVKLVGPVFGEAKDQCFHEADLLLNLSTDPGETFGYNLIESKVWGLPVICTRWDGFREVIDEFRDGVMIDCHWDRETPEIDYGQTVDICIELLQDELRRKEMGFKALSNAAKYNYQLIIPRILEIIDNSYAQSMPQDDIAAEIAMIPIRNLPDVYNLEKLQAIEFQDETPLSILLKDYPDSLAAWMVKVKPIINHFI